MNNAYSWSVPTKILYLLGVVLLTLIAWEVYRGQMYYQLKEDLLSRTDLLTMASDNPVLRWEYRANVQVYDPVTRYDVRTNNFGFRDRDFYAGGIQQGKRRIAFIGDSVLFGLMENIENIFVRKYEAYVNAQAGRQAVETLNFGVDGYNTLQISELLKRIAIQFKPDEVIYVLCVNDFNFDPLEGDMQIFFEKPQSFIVQAIERLLKRVAQKDIHMIYFDKHKDTVFSLISNMNELLTRQLIDFSVVLIPAFYPDDTTFDDYPLIRMHQETAGALTRVGVKVIDLLASFSSTHLPPRHFAHDIWHLNKAGHEHVAFELGRLRQPTAEVRVSGKKY